MGVVNMLKVLKILKLDEFIQEIKVNREENKFKV